MNIEKMTAFDIRSGIMRKQFTAKEAVTSLFERIYEKEPIIDGFLTLCREEALTQAEQIDEKIIIFILIFPSKIVNCSPKHPNKYTEIKTSLSTNN